MMEYRNFTLLWLGIGAALFWSLHFWRIGVRASLVFPGKAKPSLDIKRVIVFLIGLIGWGYISYSLTGPRIAKDKSQSNIKVNDIFFVVDVSRSMLADDLQPNRLEVAKRKLREFVQARPTDRLGVIIFSERVFTLLPLTIDPDVVGGVINDIRVGYLGSGTNMGDALGLAIARAKESQTENKVIILLTDGVNNVGNMTPMQAAELARKENIKVYTIGIGTDHDARIPLGKGVFGMQYQTIPGGSIDLKTLENISKKTGGKSYRARSEGALHEILSDIEKLERTEIDAFQQIIYDERYYSYLLWGVFLFLLAEALRRFILREVL